jgi:hypothetical protein
MLITQKNNEMHYFSPLGMLSGGKYPQLHMNKVYFCLRNLAITK